MADHIAWRVERYEEMGFDSESGSLTSAIDHLTV